jgi:hypothetical protein
LKISIKVYSCWFQIEAKMMNSGGFEPNSVSAHSNRFTTIQNISLHFFPQVALECKSLTLPSQEHNLYYVLRMNKYSWLKCWQINNVWIVYFCKWIQ